MGWHRLTESLRPNDLLNSLLSRGRLLRDEIIRLRQSRKHADANVNLGVDLLAEVFDVSGRKKFLNQAGKRILHGSLDQKTKETGDKIDIWLNDVKEALRSMSVGRRGLPDKTNSRKLVNSFSRIVASAARPETKLSRGIAYLEEVASSNPWYDEELGEMKTAIDEAYAESADLPKSQKSVREVKIPETQGQYDVTISYAGEDVSVATAIAERLREMDVRVWFDKFEVADLWGKDLSDWLRQVYGEMTRYVLVLVSKHYAVKDWTDFEFSIARGRAETLANEFILPVRLDDTVMPGLKSSIVHLDLREKTVDEVSRILLRKLRGGQDLPEPIDAKLTARVHRSEDRTGAYLTLGFGDTTNWMPWDAKPRLPRNEHFWTWWGKLPATLPNLDSEDRSELAWLLKMEISGVKDQDKQGFSQRLYKLKKTARDKAEKGSSTPTVNPDEQKDTVENSGSRNHEPTSVKGSTHRQSGDYSWDTRRITLLVILLSIIVPLFFGLLVVYPHVSGVLLAFVSCSVGLLLLALLRVRLLKEGLIDFFDWVSR